MLTTTRAAAAAAMLAVMMTTGLTPVGSAAAHSTGIHDNCTNFNKKYPHGVGRRGATDQGGDVTNFKRSTKLYNRAESHNSDLDRDNDKIACEKA